MPSSKKKNKFKGLQLDLDFFYDKYIQPIPYLLLNESDRIYDVTVSANLAVIRYNVGDSITLEYTEGKDKCTVLSISETQ